MDSKQKNQYISDNWLTKTQEEISKYLGINSRAVRARAKKLKLPNKALYIIEQRKGVHTALNQECENIGIPKEDVNHYWYKGEHFSIHVKNNNQPDWDVIRAELIGDMQKFAPKYPVIKREKKKDNTMLMIDVADPHFGKRSAISETGQETNLIITEQRFSEGIESLINKVDSFNFDKIVFVGGNDVVHTDNAFGTTTSGTRQDTDGLWHENFLAAKRANIQAIDRLLTIADVHFVFCPSNHDFLTGFFLADTLKSWYSNNKNITFDVTPIHRKYIQYGYNLLGYTHGDGAKEGDLSDLMKTEAKKAWAASKYAYWFVHHIHHKDKKGIKGTSKVKIEKDYRNMTVFNTGLNLDPEDYCFVEYIRSLSGTDRWHFTNGFVHSPSAMEGFIIHPLFGQINRLTHLF